MRSRASREANMRSRTAVPRVGGEIVDEYKGSRLEQVDELPTRRIRTIRADLYVMYIHVPARDEEVRLGPDFRQFEEEVGYV